MCYNSHKAYFLSIWHNAILFILFISSENLCLKSIILEKGRRFSTLECIVASARVLDYICFSKDKQKRKELVENDSAYQRLEESAYDVAVAFVGATTLRKIKSEKEGNVDMCQAIREMMEDERNEGIQEERV